MGDWEWTERALPIKLDRVTTAQVAGGALHLVRHRDLASFRIDGDEAAPWHGPVSDETRIRLDDRNLQVALDEAGNLYALLADGSTWRRARDGDLTPLSPPDLRLAGHYAHRVGFVWDLVGERLVIVGGDHRNDAYALRPGGWVEPLPHGPPHGVGQTVATAHGVYHLVRDELWLLRSEGWVFVDRHRHARSDRGQIIFWDPGREALFFVIEDHEGREPPFRVQMTTNGPTAPLDLPGSFAKPLEAHEAVAAVDPASGRLWSIDRLGARFLELDALRLESGGPPLDPMPHDRRIVTEPPSHWFREAISLRQRDEEAPPLDVPVREGWVLAASLPITPSLPVGETGTVLLFARELPYDHDPWTLDYTNAFEVRIVDEALPLTAGGMQVSEVRYREVDPVLAARVDTAWDGAPHLARRSKIGGFPALVRGSREDAANAFVSDLRCEDCEARLRFVAQLAWPEWDVISAVVYLYACPFGHSGAAYAQSV